jgi:hypothetical protein
MSLASTRHPYAASSVASPTPHGMSPTASHERSDLPSMNWRTERTNSRPTIGDQPIARCQTTRELPPSSRQTASSDASSAHGLGLANAAPAPPGRCGMLLHAPVACERPQPWPCGVTPTSCDWTGAAPQSVRTPHSSASPLKMLRRYSLYSESLSTSACASSRVGTRMRGGRRRMGWLPYVPAHGCLASFRGRPEHRAGPALARPSLP